MTRDELAVEIRAAEAAHPNMTLALSIHPEAPWQKVVSFVELVEKLSVVNFSFSMTSATAGVET
jgi:hypothetical protein